MSGPRYALKSHNLGLHEELCLHNDLNFPAAAGKRVSDSPQAMLVKKKLFMEQGAAQGQVAESSCQCLIILVRNCEKQKREILVKRN